MVGFDKMVSTVCNSEKRNDLLKLVTEKNKAEAEIKQFYEILNTNNIGMHEPLVDTEGFPRNDIDVYQVRLARHKIIRLQNDHKNLMKKIEEGLHELHSGCGAADSAMDYQSASEDHLEPFACVTLVSPGSPAEVCGLQVNDLLLEFGSVNNTNFKTMQDIAMVVKHSAGQKVKVVVKRAGRHSPLHLDLVPLPWNGQGLLGCRIDPIANTESLER